MPVSPIPLPLASITAATPKPSKVEDAARQFEGMMLAEMLRDARESTHLDRSGADGDDDSSSETSTVMDMADQQFAQMLARQGGIGLAHLAAEGLNKTP